MGGLRPTGRGWDGAILAHRGCVRKATRSAVLATASMRKRGGTRSGASGRLVLVLGERPTPRLADARVRRERRSEPRVREIPSQCRVAWIGGVTVALPLLTRGGA